MLNKLSDSSFFRVIRFAENALFMLTEDLLIIKNFLSVLDLENV